MVLPMPTKAQALLAAIRDNPDNPAPRLAYAAWLEKAAATQPDEKRDALLAQAGVVRWYAGLPPGVEPSTHEGYHRISQLWSQHEKAWRSQVPQFARKWVHLHGDDGGLPMRLDISAKKFLEHGERLLAEVPFMSLELDEAGGLIEEIVNAGLLRGVRELYLNRCKLQDAELIRLFRSPDLVNVRLLRLPVVDIGEEAATALAFSTPLAGLTKLGASSCGPCIGRALAHKNCTLTNLQQLSCGNTHLDPQAVVALVAAPVVAGLTDLDLSLTPLDEAATTAIAQSPRLANLHSLQLWACRIGDAGLRALATSPHLRSLEFLGLESNNITAAGTAALGCSPLAASLKKLDLATNSLGDEALAALCEGSAFRRLEKLHLGGGSREGRNNIGAAGITALVHSHIPATLRELGFYFHDQLGPAGAKALAACPAFPRLERLDLTHCAIGPEGAIALAHSPAFSALRSATLTDNGLDSAAVVALARASWLANLEELKLAENPLLGSAGAKALAAVAFDHLEKLDLGSCGIGTEGGLALAKSQHFPALTALFLESNQVGPEAGKAIAAAPWLATISWLFLYGNQIGAEAGEALFASPHLDQLDYLVLSDNGIQGELRKRFKKRLGTRVSF
jgi:uncharacterized protein (TIGR02996 family)